MAEESSRLVFDQGSGMFKAGFAGNSTPRAMFPTLVGQMKGGNPIIGGGKTTFCGDEAQSKRDILDITSPIQRGLITDWDNMEKLWNHTFTTELRVLPEEHSLLVADSALTPKADRQKLTEIMFETFDIPALYVTMQPLLALNQSGRNTGLVVSSGEGVTHTVPIYEGAPIRHAIQEESFGGDDVTDSLMRLLHDRGYPFKTPTEKECVRDIKEHLAYVSPNIEIEQYIEKEYELPDGKIITVANERFRCAEVLFKPSLIGKEKEGAHGIPDMIYNAISKCDNSIHETLYGNILFAGGNTLLPGLDDRVGKQLAEHAHVPDSIKLKVVAPPERKYSVWIGGSLLANSGLFQEVSITQEMVNESGASIVNSKCIH